MRLLSDIKGFLKSMSKSQYQDMREESLLVSKYPFFREKFSFTCQNLQRAIVVALLRSGGLVLTYRLSTN